MSNILNDYSYLQRPSSFADTSDKGSCLTINQPGAPLGLVNLLDLIGHEIYLEKDQQVHRLTFKSGQTLCIKADAQCVTVRGSRITFQADSTYPYGTLLSDPARPNSSNKPSI